MASSPTWERTETDPSQGFEDGPRSFGGGCRSTSEALGDPPPSRPPGENVKPPPGRLPFNGSETVFKPFHPVDLRPSACTRGVGSLQAAG
ncbi:hypothetical protein H4Q26_010949 [Puccinia striiformis f. sp. tritici PST-130]|nr:hypothetical protein H4Q26_010949 [Puccinia striiformis f. sp. tritici PST-130]